MIFRMKRYSAVDLIAGFPKWEYFEEKNTQAAIDFRNTIYGYDVVYGMAHKKAKLQEYRNGKWKTIEEVTP